VAGPAKLYLPNPAAFVARNLGVTYPTCNFMIMVVVLVYELLLGHTCPIPDVVSCICR
jgi:hypothetical protein